MTKTEWRRGVSAIGIMAAILMAGCSGNERLAHMNQGEHATVLPPAESDEQHGMAERTTASSDDRATYRISGQLSTGSRHVAIEARHFLVYKDFRQLSGAVPRVQ